MNYITNNDTIIFSPSFNDELDYKLLNVYKKIIFSNYDLFEKYENNNLENIKYIGSNFNQSVDNLPSDITHLTFGYEFNQTVNNLPSSLTHLTFDYEFNQTVNNLPSSITNLTFGLRFNQSVDNLPSDITHLTFGYYFNQSLNNLPRFTECIRLPKMYDNKILNIPKRLKKIYCSGKYIYLSDFIGLKVSTY